MKYLILTLVLFLGIEPAAAAKEKYQWTAMDSALQATLVVLLIADWRQTREFTGSPHKYPTKYESNPFLPSHPTPREVNVVTAASLLFHTGVARALPRPYRTIWQSFWIGVEANAVYSNYTAGIKFRL